MISQEKFPSACEATEVLQKAGGNVYVVGGYVRDLQLGVEPKDVDLMVTGLDELQIEVALSELPGVVNFTGKKFGVYRYRYKGDEVEIAMPRKEVSTGIGHKEFGVQVSKDFTVEDDLWRRDFTVNAMAIDMNSGDLIDPYKGLEDIEDRIVCQVNPESISEDPVRILRALVLVSRHGFAIHGHTKSEMSKNAENLKVESGERISAELDKIMTGKFPVKAIRQAHNTGVLKAILPEVDDCFGYDQNNPHHKEELGDHLLSTLEIVARKTDDVDVRLAALFHDIGKPGSAWENPETGFNHFYKKKFDDGTTIGEQHEELGEHMVRQIMKRLKYPVERRTRVATLVLHHMYTPFTSKKGARKFINRVGEEYVDDLLLIRLGDQGGKAEYPSRESVEFSLENEEKWLKEVREGDEPTDVSKLAINGSDLIAVGFEQGPAIGRVLAALVERVLDCPTLNDRDTLIQLAIAMPVVEARSGEV